MASFLRYKQTQRKLEWQFQSVLYYTQTQQEEIKPFFFLSHIISIYSTLLTYGSIRG